MKPLKKNTLSLSIGLALLLGNPAWAGIGYSGDTVFNGDNPPPAQGADSWNAGGSLGGSIEVGLRNSGLLEVRNGARISGASLTIGNSGLTVLDGNASAFDALYLTSRGNLFITNGARLNLYSGFNFLESGSVTLLTSGAQLTIANTSFSNGFTIRDGAIFVIQDNAKADISGDVAIGGGDVQVKGSGSRLEAKGNLNMSGTAGQRGRLAVSDGALVNAGQGLSLNDADTYLSVTGAGSQLNVAGDLVSSGVVALSDGGSITAADLINRTGGIVLAEGSGTALRVNGALTNENILQITDGASVSAGSLNNSGRVNLSGDGTRLDVTGQLTSTDSLLVQNGATLAADVLLIQGGSSGLDAALTLGGSGGTVEADAVTLSSGTSSRASVDFRHGSGDLRFAPRITGDGDVNVFSGVTTLLAQNDYTGETSLSGGTLRAGAENVLSAGSPHVLGSGGRLALDGFSQRTGDFINGGTVDLAGRAAGAVLTVDGNYTGRGGLINFGTRLGADGSPTDRLVVTGDTAGDTFLRVTNLGGSGAATLNGIGLVEVQGRSDGNFIQENRIVAGAYDYRLYRDVKNWKITSLDDLESWLPIEQDDGSAEEVGEEGGPGGEGSGPGTPGQGRLTLRPEGAAYAANLAAASRLFDTRRDERQGTWYTDPQTGGARYTPLWLRTGASHARLNAGDGQLKTRANGTVTQLGSDLRVTETTRLGVMAGYGTSRSRSASSLTGYRARGEVSGYGAGVYGSWQAAGTEERGPWAAGTLQYGRFNNSVSGEDQAGESYKSAGLTASLEAGYVIPLGGGERTRVFVQPQARAAWSGIRADDHTEANGTRVRSDGQNNVRSSVGVKTFMKSHAAQDDGTGREFTSFVEANWIHNTQEYGATMDGVRVSQQGGRNAGELRAGVEGRLGSGFGVTLTAGQQAGAKGWSESTAALGVSYRF